MIGESRQEYVFIRLCIFFLHWLAPFSICYCALALIDRPIRYRLPLLVERWLTAEALFYLLGYLPRNSYLQRPTYHPSLSRQEREELFSRCHETIPDPEGYIQKWFLNAPLSQIKRDNVKEFFAWAFLNKDGWNAEEDEELEEYVDRLEKLLGKTFEFGRSPVAPLRLTLDVVLMMHRSILWYLVSPWVNWNNSIYTLNLTIYSVSPSLTPSPISTYSSTRSTSTAPAFLASSPSSPSAPSPSSPAKPPPHEPSPTGTAPTPPPPGSPSYSSTASASVSTLT